MPDEKSPAEAAIRCPECNEEVAATAKACPRCGAQMLRREGAGAGTLVLVVLIVAALLALWAWQGGR